VSDRHHPITAEKNSSKNWRTFRLQKSVRQLTTITTHFTTNSPSKHHVLHPVFRKTPCKNALSPRQKKKQKKGGPANAEPPNVNSALIRGRSLTPTRE
jgi:hypothetical protein